MKVALRLVGLLLAGLLLALPLWSGDTIGSDSAVGGNTNGGTAVWILPRSSSAGFLASVTSTSAPRVTATLNLTGNPLVMKTAAEVVNPVAMLIDLQTQATAPIQVQGSYITIAAATLSQITAAPGAVADCTILDANGRGYLIRITAVNIRTARIDIF